MENRDVQPRFVAGIYLLILAFVELSVLRLSWLGLEESYTGMMNPTLATVRNGALGMAFRCLVNVAWIATGLGAIAGVFARRRWGWIAAISILPSRVVGVLALVVVGEVLGLNLFLRLEAMTLNSSWMLALLLFPLLFLSREVKALYRVRRSAPAAVASAGASEDNPYRRDESLPPGT